MTVMLRIALGGLALVTAGACAGAPADAPVRTTTASGSWTAPSAAQAAERDRALVRVVSAIPGVSRLDLFLDTQKIAAGVEYKMVTPYLEAPSGRQSLRLRPAGLDTAEPLAEESGQFSAGRHYTVVILPGADGGPAAELTVFEDPMEPPDEGQVKLRTLHAAGDAGSLDVHLEGRKEPLATGLEFQAASEFSVVQPASAALELRPAGRSETMLRVPGVQLTGGGMYTLVLIGRARTEPGLETLVLEDRLAGQ